MCGLSLEERRKRLSKLLSRGNKAMRHGIQLSEVLTATVAVSFATPAVRARRHCL
jgi:hypothetical protein